MSTIKLSKKQWEFIGEQTGWIKAAAYGDKRDHRKIDILVDGKYKSSTTWANSCKEAKEKYLEENPSIDAYSVRCEFSKK